MSALLHKHIIPLSSGEKKLNHLHSNNLLVWSAQEKSCTLIIIWLPETMNIHFSDWLNIVKLQVTVW